MQREIKFRAWDKFHKTMCNHEDINIWDRFMKDDMNNQYAPLMQYTGLKDKNGKEIYEGDIIEYCGSQLLESYKAVIKYKDDRFVAVWTDDSKLFRKDIFFWTTERKIQIIGNIHENPELLGKIN